MKTLKKMGLACIIVAISASMALAKVVYVSSYVTSMYKEKSRSSQKVINLRRGARLFVLSNQGPWLKIRYRNKTGWVQKLFTRNRMPGQRMSILGSASKAALLHARKRASSNVTAASARGLLDSPRAKNYSSNKAYDPQALARMENMFISDEDLIKFLKEGGINIKQ